MVRFVRFEGPEASAILHDDLTVGRPHEEFAMQYDANDQPHSATWLELDENERIDAVMDYHRRAKVRVENLELHAMTHVVVENQVALGEATAVPATLNRLMHEGLDRHEAIHAVGSILMSIVFDVLQAPDAGGDINARYSRELATLTAASWRSNLNDQ
jgi:hypothetical protein